MKPLVSILIPAYNAEQWIGDTLRSAILQTWTPKELIVVDDGSKDRTLQVARQFESDEVRVFTQPNRGAAATRNTAFGLSRGDYIQWLDADDLLSPDKVARQMAAIERDGSKRTLVSCGWGQFLYRYHRANFVPTPLWRDLPPAEWLVRKMELNVHMQTATWLVSRELTEAAGPWDTTLLGDDDGEYFCRVLLKSDGVRFVPDACVYYREAGTGSLSDLGNSNRKREAQWRSMQLTIGYLRSLEDTPRVRAACVTYIQSWLNCFYPKRRDLIDEMRAMASALGGRLEVPRLSWKYSWIKAVAGSELAHKAQSHLPRLKGIVLSRYDQLMFRIATRTPPTTPFTLK